MKKKHILTLLLGGAAVALAAALLWGGAYAESNTTGEPEPAQLSNAQNGDMQEQTEMDRRFGVKPIGVFATAGGYFLDFRYIVTDAAKAKDIISTKVKPILTDLESGSSFNVPTTPKVGALRQTRMPANRRGRQHFMLFGNPGVKVKPGKKVKVSIGDYETEPMVVN